jgi:hypothetical protein
MFSYQACFQGRQGWEGPPVSMFGSDRACLSCASCPCRTSVSSCTLRRMLVLACESSMAHENRPGLARKLFLEAAAARDSNCPVRPDSRLPKSSDFRLFGHSSQVPGRSEEPCLGPWTDATVEAGTESTLAGCLGSSSRNYRVVLGRKLRQYHGESYDGSVPTAMHCHGVTHFPKATRLWDRTRWCSKTSGSSSA